MSDGDTPTESPAAKRSRRPSFAELAADITGPQHAIGSDPPGLRWLDRRIGRGIRLAFWWLWRTKGGTLAAGGVGAALTWLSHHLWHWIR